MIKKLFVENYKTILFITFLPLMSYVFNVLVNFTFNTGRNVGIFFRYLYALIVN